MRTVAVIGAGIGGEHCAGYAALPERFKITTVCDLDRARGAELASRYRSSFTDEFAEVLSDPGIDIIDICLPPHLHLESCLAALEAGKIVVCEKPLVGSLADMDKLSAKIDDTGGRLFPVFQYRYGLGTTQLRALMSEGISGQFFAGSLETHWDRDAEYYSNPWRGTWAGEQGGAVLGHAIHIHDLLSSLLGPVARVYAELAKRVNPIETEDCAALSIRLESGAVVTSSITLGAAGNTSRLRLMFEDFTVESDHAPYAPAAKPWRFIAREPEKQAEIDAVLSMHTTDLSGFTGFFSAMADALDGVPDTGTTITDGRTSLEFVTAIYASSRTGQPVNLPLASDHPLYGGWLP